MKKWWLYTWLTFKTWLLFTSWKFVHSKEDHKALVELYNRKEWERKQMARYLAHLDRVLETQKSNPSLKFDPPDYFVGVVHPDWKERLSYKPEEGKNETV